MPVYLSANPPRQNQFHTSRKNPVTAIVVHTAENKTDLVLPDAGAEGVARFIATRSDYGSYASVVDSDSTVKVGEYHWTMFHCKGYNSRTLGLSFACQASQWATLGPKWIDGAIKQGAREAARMCRWVQQTYGYVISDRMLTKAEVDAGKLGFSTHAALDPVRRSDPGTLFPRNQFFDAYKVECRKLGIDIESPSGGNPTMDVLDEQTKRLQRGLVAAGYDIGSSGPDRNGVDGDPGMRTISAAVDFFAKAHERITSGDTAALESRIADLETENANLRERLIALGEVDAVVARKSELMDLLLDVFRRVEEEVKRVD